MKKSVRIFSLVCALAMALSVCASAAEQRSSAYLSTYSAMLYAYEDGEVTVFLRATGTGLMDEIGATQITLYEAVGSGMFRTAKVYTSDEYPDMLCSGNQYCKVAARYNGTSGNRYYAIIKVYAADSTGSDTKTYTTAAITVS